MSRNVSCFHSDLIARRVGARPLRLRLCCSLALPQSRLQAQQGTTPVQRSYINPFPTGDRYRVLVLGNSLGDGLWSGLYRAFEEDANLEFVKRAKAEWRTALRHLGV